MTGDKLIQKISELVAIAEPYEFLGDLRNKLLEAEIKLKTGEIIIPVVGEFNSGKSSLLNTLLNKDVLPTDIVPTTATIYEIRFSCPKEEAIATYADGTTETFDDIAQVKAINVSRALLVKICSASSILPTGLVLVDTPGISSDISSHERTVVDYVPIADAIMLAIDANQGFTKTSLNFLQLVNPIRKTVLIAFTKVDTRSAHEIAELRNYSTNKLGFKQDLVIETSAKNKDIEQVVQTLKNLLDKKSTILNENAERIVNAVLNDIIGRLYLQLQSSDLDISEIETKTKKMKADIALLKLKALEEVQKAKDKLKNAEKIAIKDFENSLIAEVDSLVNVAFDKSENLEARIDDVIKKAAEHALFDIYKKHIENITQELAEAVDSIPQKIDVGNLFPIAAIKLLTETINILLLDVVIPGGAAEALLGRIAIRLAERWPNFKAVWGSIQEPIKEFIEGAVKLVTKKYVKDQILKALKNASLAFSKEISDYSDDLQSKIEGQINKQFAESESNILGTLQSLKIEKEERLQSFASYIEELKEAIHRCENQKIPQQGENSHE